MPPTAREPRGSSPSAPNAAVARRAPAAQSPTPRASSPPRGSAAEDAAADDVAIAQNVIVMAKNALYERCSDHALWLLDNLHVPLSLTEMETPLYEVIDVVPSTTAGSQSAAGATALGSRAGSIAGSSRNVGTLAQSHSRGSSHWSENQANSQTSDQTRSITQIAANLDRKYMLTEDTVLWTVSSEYNVVFVIDISQSMYTLDPTTNNAHVQTALETLEKCLMGMIQPFTVQSALGLPAYEIEPHICASVVAYCPRMPGAYHIDGDRKKLPFCRTLAHAHAVTQEGVPGFIKSIRNFLFNYESELTDSLGSFPPPPPHIPPATPDRLKPQRDEDHAGSARQRSNSRGAAPFESAAKAGRGPRSGDMYTFAVDPDAPLLHTLQIADYFLQIMPDVCSPAFVFLTDGVMRSNFAISKAQSILSSLAQRSTRCTFVQVGSCGGFTPETALGYVSDNELLLHLAASLGGHFVYASDCPDAVLPHRVNFYHQVMLIRETRLLRTLSRTHGELTLHGGRRPGDTPRERLDTRRDGALRAVSGKDPGFPWCADSRPPVVDTVVARYNDYNTPVSIGMLIEMRMSEGFIVRNVQITKLDRNGLSERVSIKMELVWHPNITITYRITNTHYVGHGDTQTRNGARAESGTDSPAASSASSAGLDARAHPGADRRQRSPNMVDITIRSYKQITLEFMHHGQTANRQGELTNKASMLHDYLRAIVDKDEQLRLLHVFSPEALKSQVRRVPRVFVAPVAEAPLKPRYPDDVIQLASRVFVEDIDPAVFLDSASWGPEHHHLHSMMLQHYRVGGTLEHLASYQHTASLYIDPGLIMSCITGMDFTKMASLGHRILGDLRAHVCQAGTWALLRDETSSVVFLDDRFRQARRVPVFVLVRWEMITNWILRVTFSLFNGTCEARKIVNDCLPSFCYTFWPEYRTTEREVVVRTTRPLHMLPVDLDVVEAAPPNLLSTRDLGDMHTYVLEWRWTYLAREGTREDLSGEGEDREIVRQALHRLALTLGYYRLKQDFALLNAKGPSTGLMDSPGADEYDSSITFYHEREGYDGEELVLSCQYQIVVDMKQSSVTARTWIEPWSARLIRMVFEDDFRDLAPLGTFQQILQPERCFQLKVPNLAEFHSQRMNMFSIMAVVNSSRLALRVAQMPDVRPPHAVWCPPAGTDDVEVDTPVFQITLEPDADRDIEIHELDESGNTVNRIPATEWYKTHGREETRQQARAKKLRLQHMGTQHGKKRAILLERFMLTVFDKSDEGKYDPYIEKYRISEYNPFILALINPGHKRKLFFSQLTLKWMSTGEFSIVAYRCFLELALFNHCNAISVSAERFNKLLFASSIVKEMSQTCDGLRAAAAIPNALDEHLYMDKWFVIRLPNNSSFLMVIIPNTPLSWPKRKQGAASSVWTPSSETRQPSSTNASERPSTPVATCSLSDESAPATPPVLTPALEESIRGRFGAGVQTGAAVAINGYTLVMECSMDNTEMRRHVRAMSGTEPPVPKSSLNLQPLHLECAGTTKVAGASFQGFVGHQEVPIPFTDYALSEITKLERMYSESYLQTIYLALLLRRDVALDDLVACQQSTLWTRRSIDVDITAFLHSQDAARISRGAECQAQAGASLQEKFASLLHESFTPLPHAADPSQDHYYYCKSTPGLRSELEICLQLALNPLFINLQCSVEVLGSDLSHERRLNMPIDALPLSLEKLCEQTGIPWRPPTDHFEPLTNVRVIVHINCLYLPDRSLARDSSDSDGDNGSGSAGPDQACGDQEVTAAAKPGPEQLFQKTMSLSSLVTNEFDPMSRGAAKSTDSLPSAVIAKRYINAQLATLKGLPDDQLELVRHCHRRFVRFVAQETVYALRDIRPVTVPLLNQVWHTIATTVDDEVKADKFEFSHSRIDLTFLTPTPDDAKRQHAVKLVMAELLKQGAANPAHPLGRVQELGGIVYMQDVRSWSARQEADARIRARALSEAQDDPASGAVAGGSRRHTATVAELSDAMPSWFLIKPTAALDGVRVLTHNYSVVTNEAVDDVLAVTRQTLMVALKAANTRLLLEEMAETQRFPELLALPDEAPVATKKSTQDARGEHAVSGAAAGASSPALLARGGGDGDEAHKWSHRDLHPLTLGPPALSASDGAPVAASDAAEALGPLPYDLATRPPPPSDPFDIASVLHPYLCKKHKCDLQFRATFPLHPRSSPSNAIKTVLDSGMVNCRIEDKVNMFFVRASGSIFFAFLTASRQPYSNPLESGVPGGGRQSAAATAATTPTTDAHNAGAFLSPDAQSVAMLQRRSSIVHTAGSTSGLHLATTAAELDEYDDRLSGAAGREPPQSPRAGPRRPSLGVSGLSAAAGDGQLPDVTTTPPGSPSRTELQRWHYGRITQPPSPLAARAAAASGAQSSQRLPHTVSLTSTSVFDPPTSGDAAAASIVEERDVPCIVLHVYGVDTPGAEMKESLVEQIKGHITANFTMLEMSNMLHRSVALTDHDLSFMLPKCEPEPAILYLPLPCFVHDLDRLLRHMRQAFGAIVSPFPRADHLAKAIRRTFVHLSDGQCEEKDDKGRDEKDAAAGTVRRVPNRLRKDLARIMEGWEYDQQSHGRVPFESMTFLYNLLPGGRAPPPPEMTSIGTGIAVISALPLSRDRTLAKCVWKLAPPAASASQVGHTNASATSLSGAAEFQVPTPDDALMMSSTARRPSLAPHHRHMASLSAASAAAGATAQFANVAGGAALPPVRTASPSEPTSPVTAAASEGQPPAADAPSELLSPAEVAALFGEYLRQFKDARRHLRVKSSEIADLKKRMDEQVDEFAGEPVLAIVMWNNSSVRLDRLFAYVSRVFWTALGEYVAEQIVYPIIATGWGEAPAAEIRLPDPYKDVCSSVGPPGTAATTVAVRLDAAPASEQLTSTASLASLSMLHARAGHIPRESGIFTELSKRQVHAMDLARQMAQYWGSEESVESLRHHRHQLPRTVGISRRFSDELRGVLETICPDMHPGLFSHLENPLVLDGSQSAGLAPKPLFPASTLHRQVSQSAGDAVYDVSSLPTALKGTRQSFCIMCTLPLDDMSAPQPLKSGPSATRAEKTPSTSGGPLSTTSIHNRRLESLMKRPGDSGYQRPSARSPAAAVGAGPLQGGQLHGLGLRGWAQSDSAGLPPSRRGASRHAPSRSGEVGRFSRRLRGLEAVAQTEKKPPSPSEYQPIADPAATPLSASQIAHYSPNGKAAPASSAAWVIIWLVGGELEMVGYNVSQALWESILDQIQQRSERETRRKQLLGMIASHMAGIFPGYDQQARHRGITSAWMDRDVTRDLVNKFAPLGQLASDDQIHYFNIERQLSPDYMRELGLYRGSAELAKLESSPPVAGMTLNDLMTELVLRQLQPEHLRWARKLTFADYTQPYVDTHHPDILFRIGSRLLRSYQSRINQVLRYDELMRIAERWRELAIVNGLATPGGRMSRMLMADVHASDTHTSSSDEHRLSSRSVSAHPSGSSGAEPIPPLAPAPATEPPPQAPHRGDRKATGDGLPAHPDRDTDNGVTLEAIRMIMGNARLLHYVCAPLPLSTAVRPMGLGLRAFDRLFRAISAMLQNLADCYIDYLCSIGFIVARRHESVRPWKAALASIGYTPPQISRITSAILGGAGGNSASQSMRSEQLQATLPGIQSTGAFLFADTERSNLVADVEVTPEILSIRLFALSRFTSEWRSAVPGYVRSSINPRSISKFTFELSKFKKLLHAKSFTYDFQLRYMASLLKNVDPALQDTGDDAGRPPASHAHRGLDGRWTGGGEQDIRLDAADSSDSDADTADNSSSSEDDSGSDESDVGALGAAGHRGQRARQPRARTVAEALHVHLDITIFLDALAQQRYYSTRFSSRKLVRVQSPMMHHDLYGYFLQHSERYHFYRRGCRPTPSQSAADADLCASSALHAGSYRMYEGTLPDAMYAEGASDAAMFGPLSDPHGYAWQPQSSERFPPHLAESGAPLGRSISIPGVSNPALGSASVAASAPEPTWKHPGLESRAGDAGSHRARPVMIRGHDSARPGPGSGSSGRAHPNIHRQPAIQHATSVHWGSGSGGSRGGAGPSGGLGARMPPTSRAGAPVTAGQYVNVLVTGHPSVPARPTGSIPAGSLPGDADRAQPRARRSFDSGTEPRASSASRLADFALSEYSASKIPLLSSSTAVRVSMIAVTPNCYKCKDESSQEARRRKERLYSHAGARADAANGDGAPADRAHQHHGRHRPGCRRHGKSQAGDAAGGDSKNAARPHRCRHHRARAGSGSLVDDMDDLFGPPRTHDQRQGSQQHGSAGAGAGHAQQRSVDASSWRDESAPLARWMANLSSDGITDPQADGLQPTSNDTRKSLVAGRIGQPPAPTIMAQISFFIAIDMDPQTTVELNSLRADGHRSRNGSLGPAPDNAVQETSPGGGSGGVAEDAAWTRTCDACSKLAGQPGRARLCGIHKALRLGRVDMRDWESRGEVWASEPTMLMDTPTVDPDEFDKEDPHAVKWIGQTIKRIILQVADDYHRDVNWYRMHHHLRMANLPPSLVPQDIGALVGFLERQSSIDVGALDSRVQELLDLGISAYDVIRSLQCRMRRMYLESTLLMTTLQAENGQAAPLAAAAGSGPRPSSSRHPHLEALGRAMASAVRLNGTPPATPVIEGSFGLSRYSTTDQSAYSGTERGRKASDDAAVPSDMDLQGMVNSHVLPNSPLCPTAVIGVDGRIVRDRSSGGIDDVLRLLLPLGPPPGRRLMLDPTFQKTLSTYVRLELVESPWLCKQHRMPIVLPVYDWSLEERSAAPAAGTAADDDGGAGAGNLPTGRWVPQVPESVGHTTGGVGSFRRRDRLGRAGASIASHGADPARSTPQGPAADAEPSRVPSAHPSPAMGGSETLAGGTDAGSQHAAGGAGPLAAADFFARLRVESLPGTLLVVDPDDQRFVARLLVLNPFACQGLLELLFERPSDGGAVKLGYIRAIARWRRRSGLYEYERKHVNMVLSTVAAVLWDETTRDAGEYQ